MYSGIFVPKQYGKFIRIYGTPAGVFSLLTMKSPEYILIA